MKLFPISALCVLVLTSCAVMDAKECAVANWYQVGMKDALAARNVSRFSEYVDSCADAAIVPDQSAYQQGHAAGVTQYCQYDRGVDDGRHGRTAGAFCALGSPYTRGHAEGIKQYCTYERGLQVGRKGRSSSNVCHAAGLGAAFGQGYLDGKRLHALQADVDKKRAEIKELDDQLAKARKNLKAISSAELDLMHREHQLLTKELNWLQTQLTQESSALLLR